MNAKHKIGLACIIDDDNMYVNLIKRIIEAKNLCQNLLLFQNGKDALAYFETVLQNSNQEQIPEIIFLDLNMPIMDGWEFLNKFIHIKNNFGKAIPLYVISSSINPIDIDRAKGFEEVKDYIVKPITIDNLEHIFQEAVVA